MKPIDTKSVRNIVVRSANWIGDAVMSLPTLRAIRNDFPLARITLLAKPWVAPVFHHCPYIDHIMIYEASGRHKGVPGVLRLSRDMRKNRFDLAVLFQNAFEAALLAFLAGIPARLGYKTDGRHLLLTHGVPVTVERKKAHQVDYYLGIVEGANLPSCGNGLSLTVTEAERRQAEAILGRCGIESGDILIGINPGAAFGTAKRWFPERYAQLGRRLKALDQRIRIVVFGGPGEKALGEWICGTVGKGCMNLSGMTSLREAIGLIDRCRLFITNDSGLMHIAAALHVCQLAIFGSTNHVVTAPFSDESSMIRVCMPCSPCLKPDCPAGHHDCMKAVTVDMVYAEAEKRLVNILRESCSGAVE
ncbi:MAG: lipopolysaccharide heptosyltransferase II [Desulfobacterales bacterium]|nr:lipopolysaccharide heptosyltransferase II [Desulfobacterales bacterium]MDD4071186.1 lipopolysaccharide heptosyltransferase II [Desulfobacterales bacterium]MDD4392194.1 lipopolysaccharide heptosyltransferase II [Desulfobacterales bacterium]